MTMHSDNRERIFAALATCGDAGATARELATKLAADCTERTVQHQLGRLMQAKRVRRVWEWYAVEGQEGPHGRWRWRAARA